MSLSLIFIRIVFGLVFAVLGYFIAEKSIPPSFLGLPQDLTRTLSALLFGALALFLLPFIILKIKVLFTRWIAQLIQATVAKVLSDFWSQRKKMRVVEPGKKKSKGGVLLDTSAIIDGRIQDVIKAGFVDGPIIVPQFVLDELQNIADSENPLKRERGRRGLAVLKDLKDDKDIGLRIENFKLEMKDVDAALVQIAKKMEAKIATCDFNLNKVANLSGVKILNVNELANAVKIVTLPGELLKLKIFQEGKEESQGVGYLKDGTMIVVENGRDKIGEEVEVEVSKILQTSAGRMVFAVIKQENIEESETVRNRP